MALLPVNVTGATAQNAAGYEHPNQHNILAAFRNHISVDPLGDEGTNYSGFSPSKLKIYEGTRASPVTNYAGATVIISKTMDVSTPLSDSNAGLFVYVENAGRVQPVAIKGTTVNSGNSDTATFYATSIVSGIRGGA